MSKDRAYLTTAYFLGQEINIVNGYKSPRLGFMVEIFSSDESITRQSVSVWKLNQKNADSAENFFQKIFGLSYKAAKNLDEKKGVDTKTKFLSEINNALPNFSGISVPKRERIPEDVILFAMAMSINHGAA